MTDKKRSTSITPSSGSEDLKISETLLKYQEVYDKDPHSKIFAPLAEAYRKAGQLEMAFSIAKRGCLEHPSFASGLVTLSRILIDTHDFEDAISNLKTAVELSPDNFLAHKLLGETYIQLKQPKKALQVFKMALYLDPQDAFAKKMVKKLESLSADDFGDDVLEHQPLEFAQELKSTTSQRQRPLTSNSLDRFLSLIDAFISRNDFENANLTLTEAFETMGKSPELLRRQLFLSKRFADSSENINDIDTRANQQLKTLRTLLHRIENRRIFDTKI